MYSLKPLRQRIAPAFSGTVRPETVPETVFALGAAAELATAGGWRLRLGYAGMAAGDGGPVRMAGASVNLRFRVSSLVQS